MQRHQAVIRSGHVRPAPRPVAGPEFHMAVDEHRRSLVVVGGKERDSLALEHIVPNQRETDHRESDHREPDHR